jgi:hypothetical protein
VLDANNHQGEFGEDYIRVLASAAGLLVWTPDLDYDGVDPGIRWPGRVGWAATPAIDVQVKSWSTPCKSGGEWRFDGLNELHTDLRVAEILSAPTEAEGRPANEIFTDINTPFDDIQLYRAFPGDGFISLAAGLYALQSARDLISAAAPKAGVRRGSGLRARQRMTRRSPRTGRGGPYGHTASCPAAEGALSWSSAMTISRPLKGIRDHAVL